LLSDVGSRNRLKLGNVVVDKIEMKPKVTAAIGETALQVVDSASDEAAPVKWAGRTPAAVGVIALPQAILPRTDMRVPGLRTGRNIMSRLGPRIPHQGRKWGIGVVLVLYAVIVAAMFVYIENIHATNLDRIESSRFGEIASSTVNPYATETEKRIARSYATVKAESAIEEESQNHWDRRITVMIIALALALVTVIAISIIVVATKPHA
jgi:hypothetical protein